MNSNKFDLFVFGNISKDIIITKNSKTNLIGGAVLHAVWTAYQLNYNVCVLTKTNINDINLIQQFPNEKIKIIWISSLKTTSIQNEYIQDNLETRICTSLGEADEYKLDEFPQIEAKIYQYAALETKEVSNEILKGFSKKGNLAIDAQGMIRKVLNNKRMEFSEWRDMEEILPFVTYFKADAAEAQFITGIDTTTHEGRIKAGNKIIEMGAKEVIITYNTEVISISAKETYSFPFKNRNNSGRTGRGDTCFTSYILTRLNKDQEEATLFSAALTSLKMESPGPFKKSNLDVLNYLNEFYK